MSNHFKTHFSLSSRRKPGSCCPAEGKKGERGNMLFMILIAVVLIGLLTAVIMQSSGNSKSDIDDETLVIRVSEAQRAASEFERAVLFITSNGISETDIRFSHPAADADYGDLSLADELTEQRPQVFHPQGGGASYNEPPAEINDGSAWEFYGSTAIPGAGSSRADLVAVLPNVTLQFCDRINALAGQPAIPPEDTGVGLAAGANPGECVNAGDAARFNDTQQFYDTPNTMDETTFTQDVNTGAARTALQACVKCDTGGYHFYHVLLAR
jgi:hypothetical protein